MFVLSHAVEVNPAGSDPVLSADEVWSGLVMKAENALPFVPAMTKCDVIERGSDWLLREISFEGQSSRERITLRAPIQVHFERLGENGSFIENTISTSESGLILAFTFGMNFPGIAAGSADETEKGNSLKSAYVGALTATLRRVREMKAAGELKATA
jgi:hypothetical protein